MDYLGFVITSNFLKNPQPANDMAFHRIFPFYGNFYIPKHLELHGFSSTLTLRGSEEYGKSLCFPILSLYYVNSLFPYFWNCMDFCWSISPEIFKKPINLKYLCFPILSPYYGNPLFLCFWNCMGFCFTQNISETQNFQMFVFFTYFSGIMRIHVSHVLGTVWIFASWEKFWKPLTLKCLCFPIFSPYYGNSLFPYFGKCMDFCFTQNIWETHKFEMFVFSHTSFVPWKSTFPIFSKMHGFLLQAKNLSNP